MSRFIDREEELRSIRERLGSPRFELIVVYGRRRVGKTRLVLEAVKGTRHVYYLAVEGDNLRHFRRVASLVVPELRFVREDWEAYFNFLRDLVIVIDEFPNLIREDPGVVSVFQRIVDTVLQGTRTKLILVGSSVSMMTSRVLSYRSPLYGRRTASLRLGPMGFFEIRGFFPGAGWEELVEIYGFADGIPFYLERVSTPFWDWLGRELARPDSFLRDELDFMLRYEFVEVATYKKILEAIAMGRNTPKEIREYTGLRHSDITPYLRNLIEVGLVRREVPVTESERSKKGRYYISDNFTAFWLRYIQPNLSAIEEGVFSIDTIRSDYPNYLAWVFEKIARQFLVRLNKQGRLPLRFTKIGRWWHRGEEVDIVALDPAGKKALLVEVKWSKLSERDAARIIARLEAKAEKIRELRGYQKHLGLVAKRIEDKEGLRETGVYAWDLRDFDQAARGRRGEGGVGSAGGER